MQRSEAATVVLCGPVCAGKTTLGLLVATRISATFITARKAIEDAVGLGPLTRDQLVREGASLEADRPGIWLAEAVARAVPLGGSVVVDSARTHAQLEALVDRLPGSLTVYLSAPDRVRQERFAKRVAENPSEGDFDEISSTAIEQEVEQLAPRCEVVLNTATHQPDLIAEMVLARLPR